ncbi:hypothetical protein [Nostoc favosum]|uniref:Transposase n=1 Tax=Nostoc favosum CHAB5714 TaxID=2780399 RepID=A0ABS8I7X0_9NOSO|nr:hypothetical protein [Nostoc favosum]MCC5600228.1 hypothetical protein [Nostoc favosum CHAB5714]
MSGKPSHVSSVLTSSVPPPLIEFLKSELLYSVVSIIQSSNDTVNLPRFLFGLKLFFRAYPRQGEEECQQQGKGKKEKGRRSPFNYVQMH